MDKAALLALADRVEALTGPDEETDAVIAVAVSGDPGAWVVEPHEGSIFSHKPGWYATSDNKSHKAATYTASFDAAMALVPEGQFLQIEQHSTSWTAAIATHLWFDDRTTVRDACASTVALALTAAALRARASQ